jgi:rod shape-determining protein MreB
MFTKTLYVQVRENQFQIRNMTDGHSLQRNANPAFSHPRMLVGNFTAALKCLKAALSEARGAGFALFTAVVIHPLETIDGGLTPVEERLFQELAIGAGASKVLVWVGAPLSDTEVLSKINGKRCATIGRAG